MADADEQPGWCKIAIEMLDSTDNKSAYRVFGPLEGYIVTLKVKDKPIRDVRIVEVGASGETDDEISEGFLVHDTDENGNELADKEHEFVDYADVEAIGVY